MTKIKTGGRTAGTPNKRTVELQAAIQASGLTPLEHALSVMRNEEADIKERLRAAKMAAPHFHSKRSPIKPGSLK